jgi:hypothetical protein
VVVRSRVRRDLERFLDQLEALGLEQSGAPEILEFVGTDYAYRTVVKRDVWSRYLVRKGEEVKYETFKTTAAGDDHVRSRAYFDVWSRLYLWQDEDSAS